MDEERIEAAKQALAMKGALLVLDENAALKREIAIAGAAAVGIFHILERLNGGASAGYNPVDLVTCLKDCRAQAELLKPRA